MLKLISRVLTTAVSIVVMLSFMLTCYAVYDQHSLVKGAAGDYEVQDTITEKLSKTISKNEEVCGWLTLDGTNMDYGIAHTDNNIKYTEKGIDGEDFIGGALFLSCENKADFSDSRNIIYGHNVSIAATGEQIMFAQLSKYQDSDFFRDNASGSLAIGDKVYGLEVFAVMTVKTGNAIIYDPTYDMNTFLEYVKSNAEQYRAIGATGFDKYLILSTCAEGENRTVVIARVDRR